MTKIAIDIDIGGHPANLVAESIEVTLKAVTKDRLNTDDADSVFDLQSAYLLYHNFDSAKSKPDIFRHSYHWTKKQLNKFGKYFSLYASLEVS